MRRTSEQKAETHRRIVETAAKEFRSKGLQGIGIADLMARLGLTHGGFYAHFKDRDALVREAAECALHENLSALLSAAESGGKAGEVEAMLHYYLQPAHRDSPARGCTLAALAAEVARQPKGVRKAFTGLLKSNTSQLAQHMPGGTEALRLQHAMFLLSGMVGALAISRAISDPEFSDAWLAAVRDHYVTFFQKLTDDD